ncbi:hypothetical protein CcI6DRAFT_04952, partial [Frankia sp. CcI6]
MTFCDSRWGGWGGGAVGSGGTTAGHHGEG